MKPVEFGVASEEGSHFLLGEPAGAGVGVRLTESMQHGQGVNDSAQSTKAYD